MRTHLALLAVRARTRRAGVIAAAAVVSLTLGGIAIAQAPFTDIQGNTHEEAIRQAYELGITAGTTPTTYSPGANVRRDQMASFLMRTLDHAHPQFEVEWRVEPVDAIFVLPDGTTFTGEDEVEAQMKAFQEDEPPPVGSQLYLTEEIWTLDDTGEPDEAIGTAHIVCVAHAEPGRANCESAYEIDGRGNLHVASSFNFIQDPPGTPFDVAVMGGTGEFFGATGALTIVEEADLGPAQVTGTVLLHGTR